MGRVLNKFSDLKKNIVLRKFPKKNWSTAAGNCLLHHIDLAGLLVIDHDFKLLII